MTSFGAYPTVTTPFGASDADIQIPEANGISQQDACPYANGGTQITRHQMNGIGYLATIGAYLDRLGYSYGYTYGVRYPKGAIVTIFDPSTNRISEYLNTQDDNGNAPANITQITEDNQETSYNGWVLLNRVTEHSFFPDYTNRELIESFKLTAGESNTVNITPNQAGWVLVTRTIEGWDSLSIEQKLALGMNGVEVRLGIYSIYQWNSDDEITIRQYEGATASRFLPCPEVLPIRVPPVPDYVKSVSVEVYFYTLES